MVGISMAGSFSPLCGGALISDQYILTAAHCCKGRLAENIQIFLGDHNWKLSSEADSFRRFVTKIKIYPRFGKPRNLNNDVCLIKLSDPISFPDHPNVRPICLPSSNTNQYEEYKATLAGWGKVSADGKVSPVLQEAEVKIMKKKKCKNIFGSAMTSHMMCIGRHYALIVSACNGDSGGSLMVRNGENFDTVGVVSWGVAGCADDKPSVMARVTSFLGWIKRNTVDSNYCPRI
jgi:secreted trypsin-like serine protease